MACSKCTTNLNEHLRLQLEEMRLKVDGLERELEWRRFIQFFVECIKLFHEHFFQRHVKYQNKREKFSQTINGHLAKVQRELDVDIDWSNKHHVELLEQNEYVKDIFEFYRENGFLEQDWERFSKIVKKESRDNLTHMKLRNNDGTLNIDLFKDNEAVVDQFIIENYKRGIAQDLLTKKKLINTVMNYK